MHACMQAGMHEGKHGGTYVRMCPFLRYSVHYSFIRKTLYTLFYFSTIKKGINGEES